MRGSRSGRHPAGAPVTLNVRPRASSQMTSLVAVSSLLPRTAYPRPVSVLRYRARSPQRPMSVLVIHRVQPAVAGAVAVSTRWAVASVKYR
jgi:hypothetical protein